jgi:hypothetical protein
MVTTVRGRMVELRKAMQTCLPMFATSKIGLVISLM